MSDRAWMDAIGKQIADKTSAAERRDAEKKAEQARFDPLVEAFFSAFVAEWHSIAEELPRRIPGYVADVKREGDRARVSISNLVMSVWLRVDAKRFDASMAGSEGGREERFEGKLEEKDGAVVVNGRSPEDHANELFKALVQNVVKIPK
jgi:hypothetical protein